jgi:hypothetical protein
VPEIESLCFSDAPAHGISVSELSECIVVFRDFVFRTHSTISFLSHATTAIHSTPTPKCPQRLKFAEGLDSLAGTGKDTEDVESDLKGIDMLAKS